MDPAIRVSDLSVALDGRSIINGLNVDVPANAVTAIVGPNGCGKSTLLRSMCGILPAATGTITAGGTDISTLSRKQISQRVSFMAQSAIAPEGITVRELVARGRFPYQSWLNQWSREDEAAVDTAIRRANLSDITDRKVHHLSGGQRQRAWLGLVLAQDTPTVLLDEPTTFLDIGHQHALLRLVGDLTNDGRTVITVLHDLQQAVHYADFLVIMNRGEIVATGSPKETITTDLISEVFEMDAEVTTAGPAEQIVVLPR